MLEKSVAKDVLDQALSTGGDFAEIFMEKTNRSSLALVNGQVDAALSGIDFGVGIRIIHGLNAIYAYTNDADRENLMRVAKEAADAIKGQPKCITLPFMNMEIANRHVIKKMPETVSKKDKVEALRRGAEAAMAYDERISQTRFGYLDYVQDILVANSLGVFAQDRRVRSRVTMEAVASSESEKQRGTFGPGGHLGAELLDELDIVEKARDAAATAITMLCAKDCPGGKMPVIIDHAFGGVLFHEACGHSLEATSVSKNLSVFSGRLGEMIASPLVSAVDDGTIPNAWGSANIDDEGNPTQRNLLIENGVLKGYLIDILGGKRMGMASTGSGRRQSYHYAPTSRMTNTFILEGKSSTDEIIANTEYGLYAKAMGGGSVDPTTGTFNFAVNEGYLIRNGKIAEPVRGATLIGKGHEILMDIDMVGNNLARGQGMCGSISGSIPTDVGQPMIRVKEMTVGGRNA